MMLGKQYTIKTMLVDCFIFYNELDMLEYRLKVLYEVVDKFILVESTSTFVGNPKPLYFKENRERFEKYNDKIVHVVVDDMPQSDADFAKEPFASWVASNGRTWAREFHQRNCIVRGLQQLRLHDMDLVLINDVDEIPDPNTMRYLKDNLHQQHFAMFLYGRLEQDMYYYNLNTRFESKWYHACLVKWFYMRDWSITPQKLRDNQLPHTTNQHVIRKAGWHLSYFMNVEGIQNKLSNFAHQEQQVQQCNDAAYIEQCISNTKTMFAFQNEPTKFVPLKDNLYLPPQHEFIINNITKAV